MTYSGLLENIKEKARSAYAFIAVCGSARKNLKFNIKHNDL